MGSQTWKACSRAATRIPNLEQSLARFWFDSSAFRQLRFYSISADLSRTNHPAADWSCQVYSCLIQLVRGSSPSPPTQTRRPRAEGKLNAPLTGNCRTQSARRSARHPSAVRLPVPSRLMRTPRHVGAVRTNRHEPESLPPTMYPHVAAQQAHRQRSPHLTKARQLPGRGNRLL